MPSKGLLPAATGSPFKEADWDAIQNLLDRFDERQRWWLSGYLAGGGQPGAQRAEAEGAAAQPLLIAFGGETGNCRGLAQRLLAACGERGIAARLDDLAQLKVRHLQKESLLLVICSTHGEGEPPATVAGFHTELSRTPAGRLSGLKYAVLALGDSSYEKFCQTGKDLDCWLATAGAHRLMERLDCDVDYEKDAERWMAAALEQARILVKPVPAGAPPRLRLAPAAHDKRNPFAAEVLESSRLSHVTRQEGIWHIVLAGEGKLDLQPGDAVGVLPLNDAVLVEEVLALAGLDGSTPVRAADQEMPLRDALLRHADLTVPGKALLEQWAEWHEGEALRELCGGTAAAQRKVLKSLQVRDLLQWFPARARAQAFVDALRPLQPRLYDIANYNGERPEELHLCVQRYQYWMNGRRENGIASCWLTNLTPGERVRIFPHASPRFRLPQDPGAPLILIAAGTGIAPYRAFVQKMKAEGSRRPCWILLQEMRYEEDFLYQLEWQEALREGLVTAFDGVFQNDDPTLTLAGAALAQSGRLLAWLERGAHLYLAGERKALLECEAALTAFLDSDGRAGGSAETSWSPLVTQGRVHRNLY